MKIQVVGPGCMRCKTTYQNVVNACAELGLAADISHVTDIREFAKLGVLATPAIIVDGKKVCEGKVPAPAIIKEWLKSDVA